VPTKERSKEGIKEVSHIRVEIDGRTLRRDFHDVGDATEKAVNELGKGAEKAIIKQEITLTPKKEKK